MRDAVKKAISLFLVVSLLFSLSAEVFADTLTLPAALREIGEEAFYGDASLDEVVIPDGAETVGNGAFAYSSVSRVHFPDSVGEIADDAFTGADNAVIVSSSTAPARGYAEAHDIPWENTETEEDPALEAFRAEVSAANCIQDYFNREAFFARLNTEWVDLPEIPELGEEYAGIVRQFNEEQRLYINEAQNYNNLIEELEESYTTFDSQFDTFISGSSNGQFYMGNGYYRVIIDEALLNAEGTADYEILSAEHNDGGLLLTARISTGRIIYVTYQDDQIGITDKKPYVWGNDDPDSDTGPLDALDRAAETVSCCNNFRELLESPFKTGLDRMAGRIDANEKDLENTLEWLTEKRNSVQNKPKIRAVVQNAMEKVQGRIDMERAARYTVKTCSVIGDVAAEALNALSPAADIYSLYRAREDNEKLGNIKRHHHPTAGEQTEESRKIVEEMQKAVKAAMCRNRWQAGFNVVGASLFCFTGSLRAAKAIAKASNHMKELRNLSLILESMGKTKLPCVEKIVSLGDLTDSFLFSAKEYTELAFELDDMLHYQLGGVVTRQGTREELANVEVICMTEGHDPMEAKTDNRGIFTLEPLGEKVSILLRKDGYKDLSLEVPETLTRDNPVFKSFEMESTDDKVLSGLVTNERTGEPMAGVQVQINSANGSYTVNTDAQGVYSVLNPTAGTYTLTFTASGFYSVGPVFVVIQKGISNYYNARLHPEPEASKPADGPDFGPDFWQWCIRMYDTRQIVGYNPDGSAIREKDGILDQNECSRVKRLKLSDQGFTSLQGIKNFKDLEYLECGGLPLTSLDVSGMPNLETLSCGSQNNQLESVNCSGCPKLTGLGVTNVSKLNASNCTALKKLFCPERKLTELNVSGCTGLEVVTCSGNQLTSLNVSGLPNLKKLYCSGCRLTSINVSGCTGLEVLCCDVNQLTNLKLSGCTGLEVLRCDVNKLTSLNVSGLANLKELYCDSNQLTSINVSGCAGLEKLCCRFNQLTSLKLSGLANLKELYCSENPFTSLNVSGLPNLKELHCWCDLLESVNCSGCTSLTTYDFDRQKLNSLNLSNCTALPTELSFNDWALKELILSGCTALTKLKCECGQLKTLKLSGCTALYSLSCEGNQLTSLDVSGLTALTELACYNNQLNNLNVYGCAGLVSLECYDNRLTSLDVSGFTALEKLYCHNNLLTSLNCSGCTALTKIDLDPFLENLNMSRCTALTNLDCNSCRLKTLDLSDCTALTSCDCSNNQLTSLNVSGCTSLADLNCGYNQLTSLDASVLPALKTLSCFHNKLTSLQVAGHTALENLFCDSNRLKSLDCSGCTALQKHYYAVNPELRTVNFSGCTALTFFDLQDFVTELDLSDCTALTSLDLSNHDLEKLTLSGCENLGWLSCDNNHLTGIDLSGCGMLGYLSCKNNGLTSLNLSGYRNLYLLSYEGNPLESLNVSGCTALLDIPVIKELKMLDISGCVGIREIIWSTENLQRMNASYCTGLTKLSLYTSPVTDLDVSGCSKLKTLWCGNTALTQLDVSDCTELDEFYCDGAPLQHVTIGGLRFVRHLSFRECRLTSLNCSGCAGLEDLDCYGNRLTSLKLSGCIALTRLDCSGNSLESIDISDCLRLGGNYFVDPGVEVIGG